MNLQICENILINVEMVKNDIMKDDYCQLPASNIYNV